ncbi:hypothetical protein BDZ45DRAFT_680040 [Acephala macrosclerotiorum]|nr:hypothetical protein BDZ45DRAFT_680040 [Acephala macrosclerotiorum]
MDPAAIPSYTLKWRSKFNTNEFFFAKPLVWTPPGSTVEQVIVVSNQNNIRILDSTTGATINSRTLDPPYLASDTSCGDITGTIGIIGTPVIDPATDIMYFVSNSYKGAATSGGVLNAQAKFYAVQLPGLTDVSGFPTVISGAANNDPTRYFIAGTSNQRASLTMLGNTVIAGFAGHCDNFNYTGMLVGVSKTTGGVTNMQAMMASPGAPSPQPLNVLTQTGGKAGIWHSGTGIATDTTANRIFFVTGNAVGNGGDNAGGAPANGKSPISTLEQATVDMAVSANGIFTQSDYFEPYEYASLNGGDRDFGSSGAALLDPYFSGGGVSRILIAGGKSGKIYVMDANNLGGFNMGSGGGDAVLQVITESVSLLSGVASYPGEGGYVYFATAPGPLVCYSFGLQNGKPYFTFAGQSALTFAGRGPPTVTSLNGKAGTGIVWMADVNQGIVAYNAVPVGGVLTPLQYPATGRIQKMQRVAFGNARAYSTVTNQIFAIAGSSAVVTPSLTCTPSPLAFGSVTSGQTSLLTLTCTVGTKALTIKSTSVGLHIFQIAGVPTTTLAAGSSFPISVTMNLTSQALEDTRVIDKVQVVPGTEGAALSIVDSLGFTTTVSLSGKVVASGGFPVVSPYTLDFGTSTVGQSVTKTFTITNDGAGALTLTSFAYTNPNVAGSLPVAVVPGSSTIVGKDFVSSNFPANGATIAAGATTTISVTWSPSVAGVGSALLTFTTNGGTTDIQFTGSAAACTTCVSTTSTSSRTSSSSKISSSSTLSSSSKISTSSRISSSSSTKVSSSSSSKVSSSSVGPSSVTASTTKSSSTFVTSTKSSTVSIATATGGYAYMGCYSEVSSGRVLPLLLANNSVTPELCESLVSSLAAKPTPTIYPFYYVEYHRECYAGSSLAFGTSAVTSLTGIHACTDVCSGSVGATATGTAKCGGFGQFNLYATKSSVPFVPATTKSV